MNYFLIGVLYILFIWAAAFPAACERILHHEAEARRVSLLWLALPALLILIPASLPGFFLLWLCDQALRLAVKSLRGLFRGWMALGRPLLWMVDLL